MYINPLTAKPNDTINVTLVHSNSVILNDGDFFRDLTV